MRRLFYFLPILFILFSCQFNDNLDKYEYQETDADQFVKLLKEGTYNQYEYSKNGEKLWLIMPEFTPGDIPKLLAYANDTTYIRTFPLNPISSRMPHHTPDGSLYLGECLLWAIEGIRKDAIFPSLDPTLCVYTIPSNESEPGIRFLSGEEILEVWKLYNTWWQKYKDDEWYDVDPLEGSPYMWH